ncbi:MAG: leucine-rich repeat domain-containing protein [Christensenellaceae bacterium]
MKILKRILPFVFVLAVALCVAGCDVEQKEYVATADEYFVFEKVEGGYSVGAADGVELPENVVIPKTHEGESVVKIADGAFDMTGIKFVVIPEMVSSIGEIAFSGCDQLRSVTVLGGVKTIGDYAFFNCRLLTLCDFNKELEELGVSCFEGTNLSSVKLCNNVRYVGDKAFKDCKNLAFVTVGLRVEYIGYDAFSGARSDIIFKVSEGNAHYKLIDGNLVEN